MIKQAIKQLVGGQTLDYQLTKAVMEEIMTGQTTPAQISSFLTAMRMKGETVEEITACATVMREHAVEFYPKTEVLEIVGTGGDGADTFNISTVAALVVAATGIPVAKHGNRRVSSACGAADVLETLGVAIDLTSQQSEQLLSECGICFLFAPIYHQSMKYAAPVRQQLGIRTLFNLLGPLANPAQATWQLLGVYDEALVNTMAIVLRNLGVKRALVVHGKDGLDEVTLCDDTVICEINQQQCHQYLLNPATLGFKKCQPQDLRGGDAETNARIAQHVLDGTDHTAKRDIVILNAGLSIYLAKEGVGFLECIQMAREAIDSGQAQKKLEQLIERSRQLATVSSEE